MASMKELSFSRLRGRENYDTWKVAAKSYLIIKGLWSCTQIEPLADKTDQVDKDLKAWAEINLLLDESIYAYVIGTSTAKSAWESLEKAFEDSGLCRKVELLKQLVKLSLVDCGSVEDYISRMSTMAVKVVKVGLKIDDEILASLMLAGLPDEFRSLVMAVENSSTKLTSEAVKTLLLQETRLTSNNSVSESAFFTHSKKSGGKSGSGGKFKFRCHKCDEIGHMGKDCPEREKDREEREKDRESSGYYCRSKAL